MERERGGGLVFPPEYRKSLSTLTEGASPAWGRRVPEIQSIQERESPVFDLRNRGPLCHRIKGQEEKTRVYTGPRKNADNSPVSKKIPNYRRHAMKRMALADMIGEQTPYLAHRTGSSDQRRNSSGEEVKPRNLPMERRKEAFEEKSLNSTASTLGKNHSTTHLYYLSFRIISQKEKQLTSWRKRRRDELAFLSRGEGSLFQGGSFRGKRVLQARRGKVSAGVLRKNLWSILPGVSFGGGGIRF